MQKRLLVESGRTSEDKIVYGGVYAFYETHGLPLDALLGCLNQSNAIVDWIDFWDSAIKAGVKPRRLTMMIETSCSDVFGSETAFRILMKLKLHRDAVLFELPLPV